DGEGQAGDLVFAFVADAELHQRGLAEALFGRERRGDDLDFAGPARFRARGSSAPGEQEGSDQENSETVPPRELQSGRNIPRAFPPTFTPPQGVSPISTVAPSPSHRLNSLSGAAWKWLISPGGADGSSRIYRQEVLARQVVLRTGGGNDAP